MSSIPNPKPRMITPPALFALQAPANEAVAKAQTPLLAAAEHGMAYVATRLIDKCPKEQRAGFLEVGMLRCVVLRCPVCASHGASWR